MGKEKLRLDPADEARERVQGKMPVSADDALSNEQPVFIDEVRGTVTSSDVNDMGVARISVMPLKVEVSPGPPVSLSGGGMVTRSPVDDVREQAQRFNDAHEKALAECPPPLIDYVRVPLCSLGGPCIAASCPAYAQAGDACRAKKMLPAVELEVSRKWLTREEFDALPPGTRVGWGDREHEDRLRQRMQEYGAAEAAEKKAEADAQTARDRAILAARQEARKTISFTTGHKPGGNGESQFITPRRQSLRQRRGG